MSSKCLKTLYDICVYVNMLQLTTSSFFRRLLFENICCLKKLMHISTLLKSKRFDYDCLSVGDSEFLCERVFVWISLFVFQCFRLHRMHKMQTVVIDVRGVCLFVTRLNSASLCGGHSMQPLQNHFGFLYIVSCPGWLSCLWRTLIFTWALVFDANR